jgi:signal transduction histidine kinase
MLVIMKNRLAYKEPLSTVLRRRPHGDKEEIADTILWAALTSLFLFLALIIVYLLGTNYLNALALTIGIVPILISIILLRQDAVSFSSTMLAVTIILLITWLATNGQSIYDIGVLGFPVILIIAGLILRGRVILNLALLIIACMAWLAFGSFWNLYQPVYLTQTKLEDFFIGSIVILVAGNAVYRLARNVYQNLSLAETEIKIREQAETDGEEVIQQLKRKNLELDRFAVRVSHDLKTPLITLAGFLGYLEKDIKEGNYERAVKDFSQINAAAKTMGKFVDELLHLSRVGRITNPPKDVAFDEIVQEGLKVVDGLLKAKQVLVEIDSIFPYIHVDRARIVQVMQNLIANAAKFMGSQLNPAIKIGFEEVDGEYIFFVDDNGIGIPPEHHGQIFELFYKLNPEAEGTGIGLGLVKKIIEVHEGKIWVESEPGKGSIFNFTLQGAPKMKE